MRDGRRAGIDLSPDRRRIRPPTTSIGLPALWTRELKEVGDARMMLTPAGLGRERGECIAVGRKASGNISSPAAVSNFYRPSRGASLPTPCQVARLSPRRLSLQRGSLSSAARSKAGEEEEELLQYSQYLGCFYTALRTSRGAT